MHSVVIGNKELSKKSYHTYQKEEVSQEKKTIISFLRIE